MELILTYFSLILLSFIIALPKLKEINRRYKEGKKDGKKVDEIFDLKGSSKINDIDNKKIAELKKEKKFISSNLERLFEWFFAIINFPVFVLRLVLIFRFGISIVWKLPFQLYEIWWFVILGLCYRSAINGSEVFAITVSFLIIISMLQLIMSNIEIEDSSLRIQNIPEHKLHISHLVVEAITIVVAFGCVFFSLSRLNPNSFNQKLDIIDSIYFSFMVGTTVGLGHIHPSSKIAQVLTIAEALFGFMFVVFMVAIFISVWMSKKNQIEKDENEKIV